MQWADRLSNNNLELIRHIGSLKPRRENDSNTQVIGWPLSRGPLRPNFKIQYTFDMLPQLKQHRRLPSP